MLHVYEITTAGALLLSNMLYDFQQGICALALCTGFPGSLAVKSLPANAGNIDSIPRLGRSPGEGNDNPLQYSCLENPMDREPWWATVYGVTKSWTLLSH